MATKPESVPSVPSPPPKMPNLLPSLGGNKFDAKATCAGVVKTIISNEVVATNTSGDLGSVCEPDCETRDTFSNSATDS